jgi:hypothetical protein
MDNIWGEENQKNQTRRNSLYVTEEKAISLMGMTTCSGVVYLQTGSGSRKKLD